MLTLLKQHKKEFWLATICLTYLAVDMVFTFNGFYLFNIFPAALLLIYLAFTRLDIIYFAVIAFTPLSVPLIEYLRSSNIDFYMPTEPMLFGIMIIVLYKSVKQRFLDRKIFNHPVSLAILFNVFWVFFTSVTSTMPLVSFKFLLARLWFLTTFYILAIYLFKDIKNIRKMVWAYSGALMIVIAYTWSRHIKFGITDMDAAHFVMNPFYRDHTSYGAVLAMIIFPFIGMNLVKGRIFLYDLLIGTIALILFFAIVFSYTRAAWISIIISLMVLIVVLFRIKFKYLVITGIIAALIGLNYQNIILKKFERQEVESSDNLAEHLQSVTNIATDASNMERINRWASALRMFKEKPILGWGPGTYMFKYAPFQLSSQRTEISTDLGDLGNAHSEYIGPLSESGIFGFLSIVMIMVMGLITAFKIYHRIDKRENPQLKRLVLSLILGFITYIFHGALNNFLDTDKASSLFWGFLAVFVSLDLYYGKSKKVDEKEESSKTTLLP